MPNIRDRLVAYGTSIGNLSQVPTATVNPIGTRITVGVTNVNDIDLTTVISSAQSITAYHSTLFREFHLRAESTYNFYVDGEDVAPTSDTPGALTTLPRYVTLRWNTAPPTVSNAESTKGVRPYINPDVKPIRTATSLEIAKHALANGYISPGVVSSLIVDPPAPVSTQTSIDEDSFLLDQSAGGQSAADHVGVKTSPYAIKRLANAEPATVVNFIDPSVAGVFDTNRIQISTDALHLTVAASLAKVIGSLEVISEFNQDVPIQNPPPDFTGRSDSPTVVYVGYVIERYDVGPEGSMVLTRTIMIDDPAMDEFIDRQVAYGGKYVYRIRSIVQWTRTSDIDFNGISTIDRMSSFSSLVSPPLASFYAGDWTDWVRTEVVDNVPPEPPDEVTVRPVSRNKEIRIAWKMPNDPQDDLSGITLVRAVVNNGRISDWQNIGSFAVSNGSYTDRGVMTYESGYSYIYALYSHSYHNVISALSDQIEARLSPADSREEIPVIQVDVRGADPMTHASNTIGVGPTEIKANNSLTFYCRGGTSRQPLRDSTYLVEVRSLSTGERTLVNLDVDATDIGVADA